MAAAALTAARGAQAPSAPASQTSGEAYKNVQVLKDMPAWQMDTAMAVMSASLGMQCDNCHVGTEYEKDDKGPKQQARAMLRMTMAINRDSFNGQREVTCNTCHRGARRPVALAALAGEATTPPRPARPSLPRVDDILAKHSQAVNAAAAEKFSSRVQKGTIEGAGGFRASIEAYALAPDKSLTRVETPQGVNLTGFDGNEGWRVRAETGKPRALEGNLLARVRREAQFPALFDLKKVYGQFRATGVEKVGDRDTWVVQARPQGDLSERLYFDQENGLLLRRVQMLDSPVGSLQIQDDYADYREVDGVKVPFEIRRARPDATFTLKWAEVTNNAPVDAKIFAKPAATP